MKSAVRAVYDCNILLQALSAPEGPAGQCIELAVRGAVQLFISPFILREFVDVTRRPRVIIKLRLEVVRVEAFVALVQAIATFVTRVPKVFSYERDEDDARYVDLALAIKASFIISRDKDLLDLMDTSDPTGAKFRQQFPTLRVVDPVEFLRNVLA